MTTPDRQSRKLRLLLAKLPKLTVASLPSITFDTFTVFQHLPLQLRQQIWNHAAFHPRKIILRENWYKFKNYITNQSNIPAIMATSSECRTEAPRYYVLVDQPAYQIPSLVVSRVSIATYINFAADHFVYSNVFDHTATLSDFIFSASDLAKIQILEYQS